jgi:prepilin-type N-terminal cleavage/methylation domain-containing protein
MYMKVTIKNTSSFWNSNKGFSLIEIMIGIGIMTIVITANLMMFSNLDRQNQVLAEKVAVSDLKRQMVAILGNGTICSTELASNVFNPSGPYVINADSLATQEINLDRIHSGTTATAPALIEKDQLASTMSQRLLVDKIKFRNFTATDRPENFFADLEVSFKGGAMSLAPVVMKMYIETDPADPSSARKITGCAESGKTGRAHRIVFTTSQSWTVPAGAKSAFVTMAGGGGSGLGWRVLNAIHSGHSGGYVFSHPVDLVPGEVMTVTVGLGGRGHQTINTMVAATPGPPLYILILQMMA